MIVRRMRHPAEVPFYVFMVILNGIIVLAIVRAAMVLPLLPERLRHSHWAVAVRAAMLGLLLLAPGLRELCRKSVRGRAFELTPRQYPQLYDAVEDFAARLRLRRRPEIFVADGNGTLNAFAGRASRYDYVVLSNDLFVRLYNHDQECLRFVLGHELGHIRLHHVSFWYRLSIAYAQRLPLLGLTLSRLREYSCDRHGAHLSTHGATGLVLLAPGRHTGNRRGFRVGLAQLSHSHPSPARRLERVLRIQSRASLVRDDA